MKSYLPCKILEQTVFFGKKKNIHGKNSDAIKDYARNSMIWVQQVNNGFISSSSFIENKLLFSKSHHYILVASVWKSARRNFIGNLEGKKQNIRFKIWNSGPFSSYLKK